jgi:hypothetical protein
MHMGDVISPYLFNICFQILLLKIELSLQINTFNLPEPAVAELPQVLTGTDLRVSYRSKKVFTFADDCNIITVADPENLCRLTKILEIYGEISGLVCNVNKTNILLIGDDRLFPQNIADLDFNIAEEITVLAFKLSNNLDNFVTNSEKILANVLKQVRIWSRYNLSLPGRISICKTMIYSQMNYIGCVIPVPDLIIKNIETLIHNFVSGNLRIAKDRAFLYTELGGLGLFNVKNF